MQELDDLELDSSQHSDTPVQDRSARQRESRRGTFVVLPLRRDASLQIDHERVQPDDESSSSSSDEQSTTSTQTLHTRHAIFTRQLIQDIRTGLSEIYLPDWIDRPPIDLGEASHGKLKADTLFVLFTACLPLILFDIGPASQIANFEDVPCNFTDLASCTNIVCSFSTSFLAADTFKEKYASYRLSCEKLFPGSVPNHHIPDQLCYWGPLMSLSEFGYEQKNGILQRINSNRRLCESVSFLKAIRYSYKFCRRSRLYNAGHNMSKIPAGSSTATNESGRT